MVPVSLLLDHSTFQPARREIESLGFALSDRPFPGSSPYGVIGGRSNARWWLVPLGERRATVAGLAMFQPVLPTARLLKAAAVTTSWLGLSGLWARQQLHISRTTVFNDIFHERDLRYAFFTGTESPHRKTAVQVMDAAGNIKGFVKVTRDAKVKRLLDHEADVLAQLRKMELRTALVPFLLFQGPMAGAQILVTDTRKTSRSRTSVALTDAHFMFLKELAERTATPRHPPDSPAVSMATKYAALAARLPPGWRTRLTAAIERITDHGRDWGPPHLAHGDFTATNTFFTDGTLYVFDWEYASAEHSPGYDLLHFVFSSPASRRMPTGSSLQMAREALSRELKGITRSAADGLLLGYFCGHALMFAGREAESSSIATWSGEPQVANFIDTILQGTN